MAAWTICRRRRRPSTGDDGFDVHSDESGTGITAPFNAPSLGPPPWFVYEVTARTATAVGTAEETPGSMRWRF